MKQHETLTVPLSPLPKISHGSLVTPNDRKSSRYQMERQAKLARKSLLTRQKSLPAGHLKPPGSPRPPRSPKLMQMHQAFTFDANADRQLTWDSGASSDDDTDLDESGNAKHVHSHVTRSWFAEFSVYMMYLLCLASGAFNLSMVWPHEQWLYVNAAKAYQLGLCVPIYLGIVLSLFYLFERRDYAIRRDEPVPVSNVLLLVIVVMAISVALGFLLYFVPYIFVFWNCDAALQEATLFGKVADIVFYGGASVYMLVIIVYSLQRARLESDKETGFKHNYEHVLKTFNSIVIILLFIKIGACIVVDKIYVVYRDMICPNISHAVPLIFPSPIHDDVLNTTEYDDDHVYHETSGTTNKAHHRVVRGTSGHHDLLSHSNDSFYDGGLHLGICLGRTNWVCDIDHLDHWSQFYTLLDRKLLRPFLYVVAAELMPLIYTLHQNSTSHHFWKMRPESPVARFRFGSVRPWLINNVYRYGMMVAIFGGIFILGYRMYLFGVYTTMGPTRGLLSIDIAANLYNAFRIALFGGVYYSVFREHPRRYQPDSNWIRRVFRPKLRNSYKTPLVHHAEFDTLVIYFTMSLKVIMVMMDTTIVASSGTYSLYDLQNITQLVAMVAEWMVLRDMLILNDSELTSWPLHRKGPMGLGALLCLAGISFGYVSFLEEFVKHIFDKITLAHAHPGTTSSMMLLSVLVTESLYFAVSLYYFTLGTCWLELFHRYLHLNVFTLGEIKMESVSRVRGATFHNHGPHSGGRHPSPRGSLRSYEI